MRTAPLLVGLLLFAFASTPIPTLSVVQADTSSALNLVIERRHTGWTGQSGVRLPGMVRAAQRDR
jgi:hypothetical protein